MHGFWKGRRPQIRWRRRRKIANEERISSCLSQGRTNLGSAILADGLMCPPPAWKTRREEERCQRDGGDGRWWRTWQRRRLGRWERCWAEARRCSSWRKEESNHKWVNSRYPGCFVFRLSSHSKNLYGQNTRVTYGTRGTLKQRARFDS